MIADFLRVEEPKFFNEKFWGTPLIINKYPWGSFYHFKAYLKSRKPRSLEYTSVWILLATILTYKFMVFRTFKRWYYGQVSETNNLAFTNVNSHWKAIFVKNLHFSELLKTNLTIWMNIFFTKHFPPPFNLFSHWFYSETVTIKMLKFDFSLKK